jgi:nucleoside-diphosphate-sugar epimerase
MTKSVGIIGGGFIGNALARELNNKKYQVKVSFRSNEPENKVLGIEYYYCDVSEGSESLSGPLFNVDSLVICIPPGFKNKVGEFYASRIKTLIEAAQNQDVKQVIFTSSTGIYTKLGINNELSAIDFSQPKPKVLYDAEQAVLSSRIKNKHVLRLGGLLGGSVMGKEVRTGKSIGDSGKAVARHPGRFNVSITAENADSVVNMVMQDDVISAISRLIDQSENEQLSTSECHVFNVVSPHHPNRQSFYRTVWSQYDPARPLPPLVEGNNEQGKFVDGDKICQLLGFRYQFDNWFEAFALAKY